MGKRLIDYKLTVKDSIINSEVELLNIENLEELRKSGLAGKLAYYLKDKDFYSSEIDRFTNSNVLKMELYVFSENEIYELLEEVYQKGLHDQYIY